MKKQTIEALEREIQLFHASLDPPGAPHGAEGSARAVGASSLADVQREQQKLREYVEMITDDIAVTLRQIVAKLQNSP